MKRLLLLLIFAAVIGVYFYDGYKPISSSWSVRIYFAFREDALTEFAKKFAADSEIKSLALHSSDDLSFELYGENPTDYEGFRVQLTDKYAPILRKTTLLGASPCGLWFKNDGHVLCSGVPPVSHVYFSSLGDSDPSFLLKYWPSGVAADEECSAQMMSNEFGKCDVILSENWTIHYEWLP